MDDAIEDRFPALKSRRKPMDGAVDEARRVLWRAFQRGDLNEEEFASTLDRLEFEAESEGEPAQPPVPDRGSRTA